MSFVFEWPRFSEQFHADAMQMLDAALNKGKKPPIIADVIQVVELEMGVQPPELEIRDIGELTTEQFRGIFRLTYAGDAHVVLRTKVQANPLNNKRRDIHNMSGSAGILAAHQPLVVPMLLRLSNFRLSGHVVLVVSKQKGVTLVFKTDPLQNVDVNSTFDSISVIQKYIQKQIESQLRNMFREDLPGIIHRLSQRWLAAQTEKKVKIKTDYPLQHPIPVTRDTLEALNRVNRIDSLAGETSTSPPPPFQPVTGSLQSQPSLTSSTDRGSLLHAPSSPSLESVFPELENYDPTYGLRSGSTSPAKSLETYTNLCSHTGWLREAVRTNSELIEDENSVPVDSTWDGESSIVDRGLDKPPESESLSVFYETYPAVGGGIISKPRVVQAQSSTYSSPSYPKNVRPRRLPLSIPSRQMSLFGFPDSYFPPVSQAILDSQPARPHLLRSHLDLYRRSEPSASSLKPSVTQSMTSTENPSASRRASFSIDPSPSHAFGIHDPFDDSFGLRDDDDLHDEEATAMKPTPNNANISYLSSLSRSYRTLSPFTQPVEHYIVRSSIPTEPSIAPIEKPPAKARRRRVYRVGGTSTNHTPPVGPEERSASPSPPSDCGLSDVEHYFWSPSRGVS